MRPKPKSNPGLGLLIFGDGKYRQKQSEMVGSGLLERQAGMVGSGLLERQAGMGSVSFTYGIFNGSWAKLVTGRPPNWVQWNRIWIAQAAATSHDLSFVARSQVLHFSFVVGMTGRQVLCFSG